MDELADARKLHWSMWDTLMPFLENQQIVKVFHNYDHHRMVLLNEFEIDAKGDIFDTAMNAYQVDGESEEGNYRAVNTFFAHQPSKGTSGTRWRRRLRTNERIHVLQRLLAGAVSSIDELNRQLKAACTTSAIDRFLNSESSQDAEKATSTPSAQGVEEAGKFMGTEPRTARNAARALVLIGADLVREQGQEQARDDNLDKLRVSVRNCVAMRVRAEAERHHEESFPAVLNTAFDDVKPDKTLIAVIKQAYHKLAN